TDRKVRPTSLPNTSDRGADFRVRPPSGTFYNSAFGQRPDGLESPSYPCRMPSPPDFSFREAARAVRGRPVPVRRVPD
ncbi:MAG: hypothetical protein ACYC4N_23435, partial [Pirellulaceae bacterium]